MISQSTPMSSRNADRKVALGQGVSWKHDCLVAQSLEVSLGLLLPNLRAYACTTQVANGESAFKWRHDVRPFMAQRRSLSAGAGLRPGRGTPVARPHPFPGRQRGSAEQPRSNCHPEEDGQVATKTRRTI